MSTKCISLVPEIAKSDVQVSVKQRRISGSNVSTGMHISGSCEHNG